MGKFAEFMDKVKADEAAKAEFGAVIGARKERELSGEDFQKIVELSEKLGAAVTLNEVKDFFTGNRRELSEEELAGVAGGLTGIEKENCVIWKVPCSICGKQIECYLPCHDGKLDMHTSKVEARYWVDEHVMKHMAQTEQYDKAAEFAKCVMDILRKHESDLAELVAAHS